MPALFDVMPSLKIVVMMERIVSKLESVTWECGAFQG